MMKTSKIKIISVVTLAISLISGALSYLVSPLEWSWSNILLSLSIALLQLFLALLIVNLYISKEERKEYKKAILVAVKQEAATYNNHLLDLLRNEFGKNGVDEIVRVYTSGYEPKNLSQDVRNRIIDAIRNDYNQLRIEASMCADQFTFTASSGMFLNNPDYLKYSIHANRVAKSLYSLQIENNANHTQIVHNVLLLMCGVELFTNELEDVA